MAWTRGERAEQEFEAFVVSATGSLYRAAFFMTWDASEAEDLVQETFLRVALGWHKVRDPERRLSYARKIVFNLGIDGSSRRSRRRSELSSVVGDREDHRLSRALRAVDDRAELDPVLRELSRQQRAVLFLRYWEDLSEREVAELLGCSVGTVKKTSWRAIGTMRQRVGEAGDETSDAPSQDGRTA